MRACGPASTCNSQTRLLDLRLGEAVEQAQASRLAHARAQVAVVRQLLKGVRQGTDVLRGDDQPLDAVADEVPAARHVGDQQRPRAGGRLQHGARHALPAPGGQDEEIGPAPNVDNVGHVAEPARAAALAPGAQLA